MKKLILSALIAVAAMGYNSAKAQNATGNASDARVPLTSPPPQTGSSGSVTVSGVTAAALSVPTAAPVVTPAPAAGLPAAPAPPTPPTSTTAPTGSNIGVRLNMPASNAPASVPVAQKPDVRLPARTAQGRGGRSNP